MAAQLPPADITRRIQDGYQDFYRRYLASMQQDLFTVDSAFYISMDPNQDDFTCTRDAFYLSLLRFRPSDPNDNDRTIRFNNTTNNRFNKCAAQGIPHEAGAEVDPIDAAIHAYSKLISILIQENRQEDASNVVEFLKMNIIPGRRLDQRCQQIKMITFMLLGENFFVHRRNSALYVSPDLLTEFLQIPRVQEIISSSLSMQNSGNRGSHGGGGRRKSKSKSKSNKHKVQTKKTHRSRFNKSK
jgi:hypothetical protein